MNSKEYQQTQNLRRQLHESKKVNDTNNESCSKEVSEINEQLTSMGCGLKQINS